MKRAIKIKDSAFDEILTALVSGVTLPVPYSGYGPQQDNAFKFAIDKVRSYPLQTSNGFKVFYPDNSVDENGDDIFFKNVPLATAISFASIGIAANGSVPTVQIEGYPWSLKINDAAMATAIPDSVASWFPFSNETAEDGTVTRNTFAQAVAKMTNYNTATATDDDTTCVANLGQIFNNMTYAVLLNSITGIDVITLDDFKTFEAANTP